MERIRIVSIALAAMLAGCSHSKTVAQDGATSADSAAGVDSAMALGAAQQHTQDSLAAVATADSQAATNADHRRVHHSGAVASEPAASSNGEVVKHTQRDAEIGAAAGAVLGVVSSKNKVQGGVVGGVVGGVLGGVVGNNVDKTRKPPLR